ncbi:uncharacterized protein EV420DRAFT_1585560, partial [Desarmillaria tabescens]
FFTTFTISLMKSIDIRSESAVKLLAEFLDIDTGGRVMAEHFAHEVYSYVRSPFKDLFVYDSVIQYDVPSHVSSPPRPRPRRWQDVDEHPRQSSRSRSSSPTPCNHLAPSSPRDSRWHEDDISPVRSISWSPSGRHYPSVSKVSSPSPARATIPDDVDAPASITDVIEPPRPADVKGKSRASDEPLGNTASIVGLQPDVKGKSRVDTPCLSPAPSNVPETAPARSKKPIRTALDSLCAHLGAALASLLSSPTLLSRISSRTEDKKREHNSSDAPDSNLRVTGISHLRERRKTCCRRVGRGQWGSC